MFPTPIQDQSLTVPEMLKPILDFQSERALHCISQPLPGNDSEREPHQGDNPQHRGGTALGGGASILLSGLDAHHLSTKQQPCFAH